MFWNVLVKETLGLLTDLQVECVDTVPTHLNTDDVNFEFRKLYAK